MTRDLMLVTWYMATTPDGIIPASRSTGTPVSLADAVSQVIDHPTPCTRPWYDDGLFSYFRLVTAPGEALEDIGLRSAVWPMRLWVVETVGDQGNWQSWAYPYRTLTHQVRVIRETDPWRALGRRGKEVLDVIDNRIPDLAVRWAALWAAAPEQMRARRDAWRLCTSQRCTSGIRAQALAADAAHQLRETAALRWSECLASDAAAAALIEAGAAAGVDDGFYAHGRAVDLVAAVQFEDRWDAYVLDALRGVALDGPALVDAPA